MLNSRVPGAQIFFRITTLVLPNDATRLNPAFLNIDTVP
jgi:hypothetical protein